MNLRRIGGPDPWKHGYSNDADDTYRGVLHMGYCKRSASWDQCYPGNKVCIGFKAMFVERHSVAPVAVHTTDPSRQAYKLDRLNIMGYYKNRGHLTSHRLLQAVLVRAGPKKG